MKKYEHFTTIKGDKLTGWDKFLSGIIATFKDGERIKLTAQKVYRQRSLQQNRFLHGCVIPSIQDAVLSEWGENISFEQAKEMLKEYCNFKEIVNEKTGESFKILLPTAPLTTIENEELVERARKWLWDSFNYRMPEPNEQLEII